MFIVAVARLLPLPAEHPVDWASHGGRASIQHVGIDHRCAHVAVPEQLLHRPDVVVVLEQVGRERVA